MNEFNYSCIVIIAIEKAYTAVYCLIVAYRISGFGPKARNCLGTGNFRGVKKHEFLPYIEILSLRCNVVETT